MPTRTQQDLFQPLGLPQGFAYVEELLSAAEEARLISELQPLPFREFEFRGFLGRRRVVSFGWRYDFSGGGLHEAGDIPRFLLPLRGMVAGFASLAAADLQHVLITEYPLGVKPDGGNFPARNRIISGLSLGVLVTEAPIQSGSLITAGFALKQGRDVFGIPGSILSSKSSGVNKLIQDGAKPVMEVNDILEALNLFMIPQQVEMKAVLPDNDDERVLLKLISHEPCHVDDLIRGSGLSTTTVSSTLMMMELKGMVKQVGGMQYVLAR